STNMNANEVIAHLAGKALGTPVHPNDEANMCQSSNDVIPAAIHLSACLEIRKTLLPGLSRLLDSLRRRAAEFDDVVKTARTHLMDAVPIRLSQELTGWASQVAQSIERVESALPRLNALALGGSAVGTGVNVHPEFGRRVCAKLAEATGLPFVETEHHFSAQAALDAATEMSGQLRTAATALMKIANDLRWMNSGPVAGLGEIALPALQPGSSIMPGKINPVMCEAAMMACVQVIGDDTAIAIANASGNFQLNTMMPLIAYNLLQSISLLGAAAKAMAEKAVDGFTVNRDAIAAATERNPILATALNPVIGYDKAAEIAKRAHKEKRRVREVGARMTDLSAKELKRLLDPRRMTEGGLPPAEGETRRQ
ncbi:MAG: class II fumarate hydratase, partial [Candidatus Sumerlaeota bacterium]|nr:class II fumarate hydratase [Candidatus Sumerlaeota bacterium]